MKKNSIQKLKLEKQTIRNLRDGDLRAIGGGISTPSNYNTCNNACGSSIVYGCTATSSL